MNSKNNEIFVENLLVDTTKETTQVSFAQLKRFILRVSEQNLQDELFGEITKIEEEYNKIVKLEKLLRSKIKEVQTLTLPPLQHGVTLFEKKDNKIIVGFQGARYSVGISPEITESVPPCSEVLLSQGGQAIVKVLGNYTRGDSAEVLNFLDPVHPAIELEDGTKINDKECTFWPDNCKHFKRLHVRCGNNEAMVVETSKLIQNIEINIGDIVRMDIRLAFAFQKLPSFEAGPLLLENDPDLSYDAIGGLKNQVELVRESIELPYLHRELFKKYLLQRPKGILLYGPPGCGKTMIARAIATGLTRAIEKHWKNLLTAIKLYQVIDRNEENTELLNEWQSIVTVTTNNDNSSIENGEEKEDDLKASLFYYINSALMIVNKKESREEKRIEEISEGGESKELFEEDKRKILNEILTDEIVRIEKYLEDGVKSYFLNVKGPELLDKYVGETEHKIRKIFDEAKREASINTPVVIFFDEMEAMFQTRGSGVSSDIEKTIVPQLLAEMDGVEGMENVIVIGASNRADLIDPAILRPGRLDIKIRIDRPDYDGAREIFRIYLLPEYYGDRKKEPLPLSLEGLPAQRKCGLMKNDKKMHLFTAEFLINEVLKLIYNETTSLLVSTTSGVKKNYPIYQFMSGAIINSIVSRAKREALKLFVDSKKRRGAITFKLLKDALINEYNENAEQLVSGLPELAKQKYSVKINLTESKGNKWDAQHPVRYQDQIRE